MHPGTHTSPACVICGKKCKFFMRGSDFLYHTTSHTFYIFKCTECETEQIVPMPSPQEIETFYPSTYYSYQSSGVQKKNTLHRLREKIIDIHFRPPVKEDMLYYLAQYAKRLFAGIPLSYTPHRTFLDIGCGNGALLDLLSSHGWICRGYEIGKKAQKGNITYAPSITAAQFTPDRFDFIRIWHVVEHVSNPHQFINTVKSLLEPNGTIEIALPNTDSIYARLFRSYWYNRDIPRHVCNYNPKNLRQLMSQHGLHIETIRYRTMGGCVGSIQHIINHYLGTNLRLIDNTALFFLFYPIDILCNSIRKGDILFLTVKHASL